MEVTIDKVVGEQLLITVKDKTITPPDPQYPSPFGGVARTIPGRVEAVEYDLGGQGIAFFDTEPANQGLKFRQDGVDIQDKTGGGYNIGWTKQEEWLLYTLNAIASGEYVLSMEVAAIAAGKTMDVLIDNVLIGTITVPNTGDWQKFVAVSTPKFTAEVGKRMCKVVFKTGDVNFASFTTAKYVAPTIPPPTPGVREVIIDANKINAIGDAIKIERPPYTLRLRSGVIRESNFVLPEQVNIQGDGPTSIIALNGSHPIYNGSGDYNANFLIKTTNYNRLSDFRINGETKKMHGGLMLNGKEIQLDDVEINDTNFSGAFAKSLSNSVIARLKILNCSWGSVGWCAGGLNLGDLDTVEFRGLNVSENRGYAVKVMPNAGVGVKLRNLKIFDKSSIHAVPQGLWNNGSSRNIGLELWGALYDNVDIYDTTFLRQVSLHNFNDDKTPSPGGVKIHDCLFNIPGDTYGVETILRSFQFYNNRLIGPAHLFANFQENGQWSDWDVHHNIIEQMGGLGYPSGLVRVNSRGVVRAKFYENEVRSKTNQFFYNGPNGSGSSQADVYSNKFATQLPNFNNFSGRKDLNQII